MSTAAASPALRRSAACLAAAALLAGAPQPAEAAPRGPVIDQMVVAKNGRAAERRVRASSTRVRVGRRRCAVAAGTPLAALVRSRPRGLRVRDFGSCSRRARDAGGLFVNRIGRDSNRGRNGWVYKVGTKLGTAGAADPSGPFGRARLRRRTRITWFYCRLDDEGSCQRTLSIRARPDATGVTVRVLAYDDEGRRSPAAGATVRSGGARAVADENGLARLELPAGRRSVRAEQRGLIRSPAARVRVG